MCDGQEFGMQPKKIVRLMSQLNKRGSESTAFFLPRLPRLYK